MRMTLVQGWNLQKDKQVYGHFFWQVLQLGKFFSKRLWWHIHAYFTVAEILLLTCVSLGFLSIHFYGRKLTKIFNDD
jgi:hypothetical protein